MLKQVYTSVPPSYQTEPEALVLGFAEYNDYLTEGGRIYGEAIDHVLAVWGQRSRTTSGESLVHLFTINDIIVWPGWTVVHYTFDPVTGALLSRNDPVFGDLVSDLSFTTLHVSIGHSGEMYEKREASGFRYLQLDPNTFMHTGLEYPDTHWKNEDSSVAGAAATWVLFDSGSDRAVVYEGNLNQPGDVGVHRLSDGVRLAKIQVAGETYQITPSPSKGVCYVISTGGVITIVDYLNNRVLGVSRQRGDQSVDFQWSGPSGDPTTYGFDPVYQRVLVFLREPDAADGASVSTIRGFFPTSVPTALQKPIPLIAPRKGRTVPVLTRAFSDAGDPVGAKQIDWTFAPDPGNPLQTITGPGGWTMAYVAAETLGDEQVDVETEA